MARTRWVVVAGSRNNGTLVNAGSITVVNSSSCPVNVHLGCTRDITRGPGPRIATGYLGVQRIKAGATITIPLQAQVLGSDPDILASWTLKSNTFGVLWRNNNANDDQFTITVTQDETYHLINNPQKPPLSEEQFGLVESTLLKVLQQGAPYEQLMSNVLQQLPKDVASGRTEERMLEAYNGYCNIRTLLLPFWQVRYPMLKRSGLKPNRETQLDLAKHVTPGGRARIDVYWRVLDRGEYDATHTYCYTFDCSTRTVSARSASNSEGWLRRLQWRPQALSEIVMKEDPEGPFPTFLKAVRALSLEDSECTVQNETAQAVREEMWEEQNPDEYNSMWTSTEILVFLPRPWSATDALEADETIRQSILQFLLVNHRRQRQRDQQQLPTGIIYDIVQFLAPAKYVQVIRLHKRHMVGSWTGPTDNTEPPTALQRNAFTKLQQLVSALDRCNTWTSNSGANSLCPDHILGRDDEQTLVEDEYEGFTLLGENSHLHRHLLPIYFDFEALSHL